MNQEYSEDLGLIITEWTDEEYEQLHTEAQQAREQLMKTVNSTSSEVLDEVEISTDGFEFSIAEFEFGEGKSVVVEWCMATDGRYELFSSDDGSLRKVDTVSGAAEFLNGKVL